MTKTTINTNKQVTLSLKVRKRPFLTMQRDTIVKNYQTYSVGKTLRGYTQYLKTAFYSAGNIKELVLKMKFFEHFRFGKSIIVEKKASSQNSFFFQVENIYESEGVLFDQLKKFSRKSCSVPKKAAGLSTFLRNLSSGPSETMK